MSETHAGGVSRVRTVAAWGAAIATAIAAAVYVTWPLVCHLATHAYDPPPNVRWSLGPDIYLTHWITAWSLHALLTNPARLYDANLFHPAPHALTASEHMLGALPVYAPLALATGDPVFAHQAMLLASFACAALAIAALVRAWTASWSAAALAGALFAFSTTRMLHLASAHLLGNYYLPLVPLFAHRAVVDPRRRWPVLLGLALACQALHSYYLGYGAFLATGCLLAAVLTGDRAARTRWPRLVLPTVAAGLVVVALTVPYLTARRHGALVAPRPRFVAFASVPLGWFGIATWATVLALGAGLVWRRAVGGRVAGAWVIGLAASAVATQLVAAGPLATLGPLPAPYSIVSAVLPGFALVRVPKRLVLTASMGIAALAGIGAAGFVQVVGGRRWRRLLAEGVVVAAAVATVVDAASEPMTLRPIETREGLAPVYRWLATAPPGPVLELPFIDFRVNPFANEIEALRTYRSIYHWHPLVNGYSGYPPPAYRLLAAVAARLPDQQAVKDLVRLAGVRYLIAPRGAPIALAELRAAGTSPIELGDHVVAVLPPADAHQTPLLAHEADSFAGRSPTGQSLDPLGPEGQRASITLPAAGPFIKFIETVFVTVENRSVRVWPGLALPGTGGVALAYAFRAPDGTVVTTARAVVTPLGIDLAPGARARVPLWVQPPSVGRYTLEVSLVQDGIGPFDTMLAPVAHQEIDVGVPARPVRPPAAPADPRG